MLNVTNREGKNQQHKKERKDLITGNKKQMRERERERQKKEKEMED